MNQHTQYQLVQSICGECDKLVKEELIIYPFGKSSFYKINVTDSEEMDRALKDIAVISDWRHTVVCPECLPKLVLRRVLNDL